MAATLQKELIDKVIFIEWIVGRYWEATFFLDS